jgi:2',3'-cyclic-nucleotide 2'-phosphodiesterase (5'-nucleotidase family)
VSGIRFTFDPNRPSGCSGSESGTITWTCVTDPAVNRVMAVSKSDGTPIGQDSTTYTMAITDFTNAGGDSYFMLADGQGATRDRDANVFLAYMQAHPNLDPTSVPLDRITICPCP